MKSLFHIRSQALDTTPEPRPRATSCGLPCAVDMIARGISSHAPKTDISLSPNRIRMKLELYLPSFHGFTSVSLPNIRFAAYVINVP